MTRARARGGGELARALSIVVALVCARRARPRALLNSSGSIDPCHPAHYDTYA